MRRIIVRVIAIAVILAFHTLALAHCEIPCGIYSDKMRIEMIEEDITTVEKSMKMIVKLSAEKPLNYNQIVRWINNKDVHAKKIQETAYQYFMAQRINPVDKEGKAREKYVKEISLLHQMIVYAMKMKQTTDLESCTKLRNLLKEFETSYFAAK